MNKRYVSIFSILGSLILIGALLAACGSSSTNTPAGTNLDGATLMQQRCGVCHSMQRATSAHKDATQWKVTVDQMIARGAQLTSAEEQVLVDYLAATYK